MTPAALSPQEQALLRSSSVYQDLFDWGIDIAVISDWAGDRDVEVLDVHQGLSVLSGFTSDQARRAVALDLDGWAFRQAASLGLTLEQLIEVFEAAPSWGSLGFMLRLRAAGVPVEVMGFSFQAGLLGTWSANQEGAVELLEGLSADQACLLLALWLDDAVAADDARAWVVSVGDAPWVSTAVTLRRDGLSTRRAIESALALEGPAARRVSLPKRSFTFDLGNLRRGPF